jgi:hypothetical protein
MGFLDEAEKLFEKARDFNPLESLFGNWTPVDSSNVSAFKYDASSRVFSIRFHSGRVYQFKDVPDNVVEEFSTADSKGKFFNANIKHNYSLA